MEEADYGIEGQRPSLLWRPRLVLSSTKYIAITCKVIPTSSQAAIVLQLIMFLEQQSQCPLSRRLHVHDANCVSA